MTRHDEIRARCEAATPGPWQAIKSKWGFIMLLDGVGRALIGAPDGLANAAFIAHSREDIPWLLTRLTDLEAKLAESQRRERAAVEERDTLMRRHSQQVEAIRRRIDAGGLYYDENRLLRELMFETRYDRRGPQEAGEGGRDERDNPGISE